MSMMGRSRDIGLRHDGPGKGDKTRVTDVKAFRSNFDLIKWGSASCKSRKRKSASDKLPPCECGDTGVG